MTLDPTYSISPLVIAVFEHALREAKSGNRSARRWLYAEGVLWIDVIMDIHPDHVRRWLKNTLKQKRQAAQKEKPHRKPQDEQIPLPA